MHAGLLRERVAFQRRALDDNGDRLGAWAEEFNVKARVWARLGTEPIIQARLQGVQPVEVTVRSMPKTEQVDSDWRLLWKARPYNIRTQAPGETSEWIVIMADHDQSDA